MSTINISLPREQVSFLDGLMKRYGFTNRSELIRGILRLLHAKPAIAEEALEHPFQSPPTRSIPKIMADFRGTKKYSEAFLKDLEEGLKRSTYFNS